MNIVALDAETLMVDGLDWSKMETIGTLKRYKRTASHQLISRAKEAEVIITNKVPIGAKEFNALQKLKLIAVAATGYNVVDTTAARAAGVIVCNVPAYSSTSVAQHVWSLILHISNHINQEAQSVKSGQWNRTNGWSYMLSPITEWAGKTMGIVGLGQIGLETARIAKAFGMTVIYHNRKPKHGVQSYEWVTVEELFSKSDIVSLHCPESPVNKHFVNLELLQQMKAHAILINTARGGLINEKDLSKALDLGYLRAAGLDVLNHEPPALKNPLIENSACIITPHIAWASLESKTRLLTTLTNNIVSFSKGSPLNVVN